MSKRVLIACEESQAVCKEFRALGHEAYSADILPCSGGYPEWHIQGDVTKILNDGWDLMIAHPPCTYLSRAGARWMYPTAANISQERLELAINAKSFFITLLNANIPKIAVENPTPLKIVSLPEHSQAVQPYEYGHPYSKRTLLWLKNLPPLVPTEFVEDYKPYLPSNTGGKKRGQKYQFKSITQQESSKTFIGIAKAMADQWGNL
jgi:hypothetical protein